MFTPPGEKIIETRKCRVSGEDFVITEKDLEMYEQLSPVIGGQKFLIPMPTICPRERQIRRMSWRNYDQFYKNTCAITGKEIISTYRPSTPYKVASLESWWSDQFDAREYGKEIDFSRPFFDQFHELDQGVLHMPLCVTKSENSAFSNFSLLNKNCYLCCRVANCEDCYYCFLLAQCKHCFDCTDISNSEYLYECIRTIKSYHSFYCTDCENCHECYFLKDCSACRECFGSCNLRNKRFMWNNKQLTEEEYKKNLAQTLSSTPDRSELRNNFLHYCEHFPKKYISGFNNENVTGNFLFSNSDIVFGFESHDSQNIRYTYGSHTITDAIEMSFGYLSQRSIEICGAAQGYAHFFCINCVSECRDIYYCKDCVNGTSDCFGCISLKKGKHCILNKQYSQQEYEENVIKLIEHMKSTGEWGEFFPAKDSPYAYNETAAYVHFSMTKEKALQRNYHWFESPKSEGKEGFIPLMIDQYDEKIVGYEAAQKNIDALLAATLTCPDTGKNYKIVPQELAFYIQNSLPIPRRHPMRRSEIRMRQTLPVELYDRKCDECGIPFLTSYTPERPEKILCDECYRKLVY